MNTPKTVGALALALTLALTAAACGDDADPVSAEAGRNSAAIAAANAIEHQAHLDGNARTYGGGDVSAVAVDETTNSGYYPHGSTAYAERNAGPSGGDEFVPGSRHMPL